MRQQVVAAALMAAAGVAGAQTVPEAATAPPVADRIAPPPVVKVAPASPLAAAAPAPLICKTSIETGSLIARRKTCLTKKQWAYVNDAHEDEARKLMMDNMGKPGSPN